MMRDKKVIAGKLCLVLPVMLGNAEVRTGIGNDMVVAAIRECQAWDS